MDSQRWTSTSDRYLTPGSGDAWAADAAQSGQRGSQRILNAGITLGPDDVTEALRLPAHAEVVVRQRLILADEVPIEVAASYWPLSLARDTPLVAPEQIPGGAVSLLARIGYQPATVREDVTAASARDALSPGQCEMLQLSETDPVLILARTIYDDSGQPYEYSVMTMRARDRRLTYIRQGG